MTIPFMLALLVACNSSDVTRSLGAQCDTKTDCADRCVSGNNYPDGLCTMTCERDRDCPAQARCVDKEGGICLFKCEVTTDCEFLGEGWGCEMKELRSDDSMEVNVCFGE